MTSMQALLRSLPDLSVGLPAVDVADLPDDPIVLFDQWLRAAIEAGVPDPHAMTLSTCAQHEEPDARVLILKDLDQHGWWFASSASSAKGAQLARNPAAALTFYWPTVGRQVRVRGRVKAGAAEAGASDFLQRGLGARAVTLGSRQSQPLDDRAECQASVAAARRRLADDGELVAPSWSVYAVEPDRVEFWQADGDRLHARVEYVRDDGRWRHGLLWP